MLKVELGLMNIARQYKMNIIHEFSASNLGIYIRYSTMAYMCGNHIGSG